MRKWMAGWIALMILTLTFVCLGEEELSFAPLTGGWTPAEDSAVADEALRVFEEGSTIAIWRGPGPFLPRRSRTTRWCTCMRICSAM